MNASAWAAAPHLIAYTTLAQERWKVNLIRLFFVVPVHIFDLLVQARTRKLEAESKLAGLQKDLAELGSVSGDQAGQEEAQTMQLHQVFGASSKLQNLLRVAVKHS